MARSKPRQAGRSAGAFLGSDPIGLVAVPMKTLSDEYHDEPAEPPEDREPEPEAPGLVHRIVDRLKGNAAPDR